MAGEYNFNNNRIIRIGLDELVDRSRKAIVKEAADLALLRQGANQPVTNNYPIKSEVGKLLTGVITLKANGKELVLENCLFDTSNSKRIVQTAINGKDGTVKEWISNGDIIINVQVNILNKERNYPIDELIEIVDFLKLNRELIIAETHINKVLKISRVVVTSWRHVPKTWSNFQSIMIDFVSDNTYEIEEHIID
ncbi:MAG: DUF6046 domain-containing protein [Bacteroidales bacterium]